MYKSLLSKHNFCLPCLSKSGKIKWIVYVYLPHVHSREWKNKIFDRQISISKIHFCIIQFSSVQSVSHVQLFADPMNSSTLGVPVHHQLAESTQTHVHWVGDAIQPSHPLSSPSPPALNLSQHQGLFQWVSSSHQVAKVLEFQLQHQSFQWIPGTNLLYNELVGSPCSPRDSQESSPTPQFKSINLSALSFLYSPMLTSIRDYWKNHSLD